MGALVLIPIILAFLNLGLGAPAPEPDAPEPAPESGAPDLDLPCIEDPYENSKGETCCVTDHQGPPYGDAWCCIGKDGGILCVA